ncbi:MAG: hypothetical protein J5709_08280, partial [Bacteroidales bacterium]|nr:hypothetical protein [Bacteroidales bacterium]
AVAECVDIYNRMRPHCSCDYNTPEFMHNQREVKMKTYKKENKNTLSDPTVYLIVSLSRKNL